MYSTRMSRHVDAARDEVYRALTDADAIARWRVPDGMTSHVHRFEAREGGEFRISLTYDVPDGSGKSTASTDTYSGRFLRLVPGAEIVEEMAFETEDPVFGGTMTVTTTLTGSGDGTLITMLHEGIPDAIPAADNEAGTRMALDALARLVENAPGPR